MDHREIVHILAIIDDSGHVWGTVYFMNYGQLLAVRCRFPAE